MKQILSLSLPPEIALDADALRQYVNRRFPKTPPDILQMAVLRQSIDARGGQVKVNLEVEVAIDEPLTPPILQEYAYRDVSQRPAILIVGAGPAGMFAALRCIELGFKPLVFERGKDVQARRRDLAAINKQQVVNPESNYCFGEGGAGTYSDGKLYTRSKKRGDIRRILEILVLHGATEQILVDAHPHIGTNKLPKVVENLRNQILANGGEVHFDTRIDDFILQNQKIKGVITADGREFVGEGVILATGHSARDIFKLLHRKGILQEAKPFAMGVRIEHPQQLIDQCQYHRPQRGLLPPATYSLVAQTNYKGVQRGVFSFCMCPGGFIVPAATAPEELVVNGMSPSRRDSRFANSGMVVAINPPDWQTNVAEYGELAALALQEAVEQQVWRKGLKQPVVKEGVTHSQIAPAQRVGDFLQRKISAELNDTSYQPGLLSADMRDVLPDFIAESLKEGIAYFGKRMKGYGTNQGQLIGVESRTSSPVRIPRDPATLEHPQIRGLYPCGEGAGYAGGIVSAAMDGERCAEALIKSLA